MSEHTANTRSATQEWREGWGVVLAAALGIGLGGIHYHFIGTMIQPLEEAYVWSRGEIAFGLTLITSIHLVVNIVVGALADRFGARPVALCGAWLFGLGFSLLGLAGPEIWTWYAACALFALIGQSVSPVVWTAGVVKWFSAQRGMALALSLTGGGFMVAVTPIMVIWLLELVGVRVIFPVIGIGCVLLIFFPALAFFRDQPPGTPIANGPQEKADADKLPGYNVRQALVERRFWQLLLALVLISPAVGTFLVHIQPMLIDSGLTPTTAASVALFIGPSMIAGRLMMGFLFDRFDPRLVAAFALLLPFAAALLLLSMNGGYAGAAIAGVAVGLCLGAEVDVVAYLTSRYFGLRAYGALFGMLMSTYGVGIGAGSAIAGMVFDVAGSYRPFLLVLAVGSLVATILMISLGLPTRRAGATNSSGRARRSQERLQRIQVSPDEGELHVPNR